MSERPRSAPCLQELAEGRERFEVTRAERFGDLAQTLAERLGILGFASLSRLGARRPEVFAFGRNRGLLFGRDFLDDDGAGHRAKGVRVEPGLHENAQTLAPERKPALALGGERHEHVFESAKRALAVDGDRQLGA